nr:hypothetical protein [Nostoc sp. ChiSLP03a]MDZ8213298.1 hypothetical protein [Nostoc sp. ChiSLP03a]
MSTSFPCFTRAIAINMVKAINNSLLFTNAGASRGGSYDAPHVIRKRYKLVCKVKIYP